MQLTPGTRLGAYEIIATLGRREAADAALRQLVEGYAVSLATQIAEVHAVRGEADAAFGWLERAYELRDGGLTEILASLHFRSLRGDPRWAAFVAKMGFEA